MRTLGDGWSDELDMPVPTEPTTNVNLNAIAEHLNLSTATVSRALRNVPGTHPRTKSLVMNAAAELGYRPQRTRTRSGGRAAQGSVWVFARNLSSGRSIAFLEGMTKSANELGVSLMLQHVDHEHWDAGFGELKNALVRAENMAGIALIHRWPVEMVRYLSEQFDCVSLIHTYSGLNVDVVDMNHAQGMNQLVGRLHDLGHRRIGFIGRNAELSWAKARFGGYSQALYSLGLPYEPEWIVDVPTRLLENNEWLALWTPSIERVAALVEEGVTAWVASSDWAGYALCRGLLDRGLRVPEDVSITGFDTDETQTLGCPRLTSVNVPKLEMGGESLRRLVRRGEEPQQPHHTSLFGCALFAGQTTAPPRA